MFLTDVLVKAGKKILTDVKTLGENTVKASNAIKSEDIESLEKLSDDFLEKAAVGCVAIAAKKAGLGVMTAIMDGDDVADAIGDALGHVNPVVMSVVGFNAVMAGVCKIAANKQLQESIVKAVDCSTIADRVQLARKSYKGGKVQ